VGGLVGRWVGDGCVGDRCMGYDWVGGLMDGWKEELMIC